MTIKLSGSSEMCQGSWVYAFEPIFKVLIHEKVGKIHKVFQIIVEDGYQSLLKA